MNSFSEYQQGQIFKFALAKEVCRVYGWSGKHGSLREVFNSSVDRTLDPSPDAIKSAIDLFSELSIYSIKARRFAKMSLAGMVIFIVGTIGVWIIDGPGPGLLWIVVSAVFWFGLSVIFQLRYMPRIRKRFNLTNTEAAFALNHIVGDPRWQIDMYRQPRP